MTDGALEAGTRPLDGARAAQEARVVVQREDQAVDLEQHLLRIGVGAQVPFVDREADGLPERRVPGLHHRHQRVAHRARAGRRTRPRR